MEKYENILKKLLKFILFISSIRISFLIIDENICDISMIKIIMIASIIYIFLDNYVPTVCMNSSHD
jgi:hypothetical protein